MHHKRGKKVVVCARSPILLSLKFLGTKHIAGAPGCYGSIGIMAIEDFSITGQYGSLSSCFGHIYLGSKAVTGMPGCYRNTVTIAMKNLYNKWTTRKYNKFLLVYLDAMETLFLICSLE